MQEAGEVELEIEMYASVVLENSGADGSRRRLGERERWSVGLASWLRVEDFFGIGGDLSGRDLVIQSVEMLRFKYLSLHFWSFAVRSSDKRFSEHENVDGSGGRD